MKAILIIGAGTGLSLGVARKFGRQGFNVGLISRSKSNLENLTDILKLENYKYCKNRFMNSMDIITADGGIDVSVDFNKQEKLVSKLLVAEIIYAVTMQKKVGILF